MAIYLLGPSRNYSGKARPWIISLSACPRAALGETAGFVLSDGSRAWQLDRIAFGAAMPGGTAAPLVVINLGCPGGWGYFEPDALCVSRAVYQSCWAWSGKGIVIVEGCVKDSCMLLESLRLLWFSESWLLVSSGLGSGYWLGISASVCPCGNDLNFIVLVDGPLFQWCV